MHHEYTTDGLWYIGYMVGTLLRPRSAVFDGFEDVELSEGDTHTLLEGYEQGVKVAEAELAMRMNQPAPLPVDLGRNPLLTGGLTMATEMIEIEVWVKVNESGEYDVGYDEESACDRYTDNGLDEESSTRLVRMLVKVPKPRPLTVSVTLPDDQPADDLAASVTAG